jgi:hypothetical protein
MVLEGPASVLADIAGLRKIACCGSASLFLEDAVMACLCSDHAFERADPPSAAALRRRP